MKRMVMIVMVACAMGVLMVGCASESVTSSSGDDLWGEQIVKPGLLTDPKAAPLLMNTSDFDVATKLPRDEVRQGRPIILDVVVRNLTDGPLRIDASTSAKFLVKVWRQTPVGPTCIRTYPINDVQVITPWGLEPDGEHWTELFIPVDRNWPTHEPLDITVTLNGTEIRSTPIRVTALPRR
jgi:hypothetical protein